jgi:ribonucleoside-diphosphate reductase alpha chain
MGILSGLIGIAPFLELALNSSYPFCTALWDNEVMAGNLNIKRHFTTPGKDPLTQVDWRSQNVSGFTQPIETPSGWSETATEVAAQKYFRRRGASSLGGSETSVRHLLTRVVRTVRRAGEWQGYIAGEEASAFEDELMHILVHQIASFNSPVYFNVGMFPEYGILGHGENFMFNPKAGRSEPLSSAYLHPQASACFIQSVNDDLIGIFDLLKSEAKLFKYGSGTGTNFSSLRAKGEALEGGGHSTGLISYLEIYDKAAQAIKSGGTTRRAAKMVVVDADHPEILDFVRWKMNEERKARVLLAAGYSGGMEGEAFRTISGQNSNNSVRVTDQFMKQVEANGQWELRDRVSGRVASTMPARELWREMAKAAWECADPGVQFHDTIQRWNLCPNSGTIRASNPCSEYMFLDNSACNLSSLNLAKFITKDGLGWAAFKQTVRILLLAQEILVDYSSYPTAAIAENSHRFRPLGLGYANLGGMLMRLGLPYESEPATDLTRRITAYMHFLALEMSQEMAGAFGAFSEWERNREPALQVLEHHREEWKQGKDQWPELEQLMERVIKNSAKTGLRNAQVTLIAPTGTIGLFMDCDTLGIEPDFSLVKRKILAGGGEMILRNQALADGLARLGYSGDAIKKIEQYASTHGTPIGAPGLEAKHFSVFDCAVPPKGHPERRVSPKGHLNMMKAAQPFLSGAISKTVNLPHSTSVEDVEKLFRDSWTMGLKSVAIYRDGSKTLQPLCAEC